MKHTLPSSKNPNKYSLGAAKCMEGSGVENIVTKVCSIKMFSVLSINYSIYCHDKDGCTRVIVEKHMGAKATELLDKNHVVVAFGKQVYKAVPKFGKKTMKALEKSIQLAKGDTVILQKLLIAYPYH